MELEKVPFRQYTLDKDKKKEKSKVFTIRLNKAEQELAKDLMIYFNVKSPATALKYSALVGHRVLHNTFGEELLGYLFKKDRVKLEDYEDPKTFKNEKL